MSIDHSRLRLLQTFVGFAALFALFAWGASFSGTGAEAGRSVLAEGLRIPTEQAGLRMALVFALALVNATLVVRIASRNLMYRERNYMPSILYLIISLGWAWPADNSAPLTLFVSFLCIYAFDTVIFSYHKEGMYGYFFNASVAIGTAVLLFPPAIFFVPAILIGLIALGRDSREWVVSLVGLLLPVFLCSYVFWALGNDSSMVVRQGAALLVEPASPDGFPPMEPLALVAPVLFGIALLLSLGTWIKRRKGMRQRTQKAYLVMLWATVAAVAMVAVLPCRSSAMMPLLAMPLAIFTPAWFGTHSGLFPNLVYALMIVSILFHNLLPLL